ncbi:MAG: hypothetical protein VW298_02090 [Candidatus Woesearchaeota archaeon]
MNKEIVKEIRNIIDVNFDMKNSIGFTGTLKGYGRFGKINQDIVVRNTKHFLNFLNYKIYGNKFRRNNLRVKTFVVIEGGERKNDKNFHIHSIINLPPSNIISKHNFIHHFKESWGKGFYSNQQYKFEFFIDSGWSKYITKFINLTDEVDWENSHYLI